MKFRCSRLLVFVHSGAAAHYEFGGLWLVGGGNKLHARNANGYTIAEEMAMTIRSRLNGQLPQGFLDYWVEYFPINKGMLTTPETVSYDSVDAAFSGELAKETLH